MNPPVIKNVKRDKIFTVNNHLHTPYSFSAFSSIEQIFQMAGEENIKSVGINDFYTTDGYDEFNQLAHQYKIYPVFNIEFIGLIKEFQDKGIRVNDPNNPGRIYFSGKALKYPFSLPEKQMGLLRSVQAESQRQIREMIVKANDLFTLKEVDIHLDYDEIKRLYAKNLVRERHLAKAIYHEILRESESDVKKANELLKNIYSGVMPSAKFEDMAAVENEIRSRLLKTGGPAFVPEDESAFLSIPQVIDIILAAGGIPCYPSLLDDAKGNLTEFEEDWQKMYEYLTEWNVGCIELIPNRNSLEMLERFVHFFRSRNMIISLGTEHNAPDMIPLTPSCRGGVPLSEKLKALSFEASCVLAAHQHYTAAGKEGFMDKTGSPRIQDIDKFREKGESIINHFVS